MGVLGCSTGMGIVSAWFFVSSTEIILAYVGTWVL